MASVHKRKNGKWDASWKDEHGKWHRATTGTTDKAAALRIARKREDDAAAKRAGLVDAKAVKYAEHAKRPIAEHVAEWIASLEAKGRDDEYIKRTKVRCEKVIEWCEANRIGDIEATIVEAKLKALRDAGNSMSASNGYLRAIRNFVLWMREKRRIVDNPLVGLKCGNEEDDRRRIRRELTPEEFAWLIAVTDGFTHHAHKLSGRDRAMLYRIAAGTGFRLKELRSLTPKSFDVDANPPTVTVERGYSKRRKRDVQPIRPDLAELIRLLTRD